MGLCIYACKIMGTSSQGGTVSGKIEGMQEPKTAVGPTEERKEEREGNKSTESPKARMQMKSIKSGAEYMYVRRDGELQTRRRV